IHLNHKVSSDVNILYGGKSESAQRICNGLALRIEETATWSDVNGDAESTHTVWSFGGVAAGGGGFEEPDGSSFRGVARGGLPGVWRFARSSCSGLIGRSSEAAPGRSPRRLSPLR